MSFTHAIKWSFASELASKATQPIVFIVMTRLLKPEDFGVMTAAIMVMAFSQIFWEAGMCKALIQRQENIEEAANAAFLMNIALGIFVAGLLYMLAEPIAQGLFQDSRVSDVLKVMTLNILLGAMSSVHATLLQKELDFKTLFWTRVVTVSLPGLASIPLACYGFGYWSLVAGTLVGQFGQVLLLWKVSRWSPKLAINMRVLFDLWNFGRWVLLTGLLGWFYQWMDSFFVGLYMGSHELGLYRTGNQLILLIYSSLTAPLMQVLYSWMATKGSSEIKNALEDVASVLALCILPIAFFINLEAFLIARFLFDLNWIGVEPVISVMALSHGLSYIMSPNSEAYRATGNPQLETLPMIFGLLVFIPTYTIAASVSLEFFIYTRLLIVVTFGYAIHAAIARKYLNIKLSFFFKFLAATFCIYIFSKFISMLYPGIASALFSAALSLFLFTTLVMMDRSRYKRLYKNFINRESYK